MKLDQIFYGNAGSGYKVLVASDASLADKAAEICRAIGTPDGIAEFTHFLISVPVGNKLFAACCCPGRADALGRKTLFFHVIVADCAEASRAGINAFSLWEAKRFADRIPLGGAVALELERLGNAPADAPAWDGLPARLPRSRPANDEIRKMLGSRVNDCAWATFSFRNLEAPFALYAVSKHIAEPTSQASPKKSTPRVEGCGNGGCGNGSDTEVKKFSTGTRILAASLCVSLALNAWSFFSEKSAPSLPPAMPKEEKIDWNKRMREAEEKGRAAGYEQAFAELKEEFPKDNRILDKNEVSSLKRSWQRAGAYVDFVERKIFNRKSNSEKGAGQ